MNYGTNLIRYDCRRWYWVFFFFQETATLCCLASSMTHRSSHHTEPWVEDHATYHGNLHPHRPPGKHASIRQRFPDEEGLDRAWVVSRSADRCTWSECPLAPAVKFWRKSLFGLSLKFLLKRIFWRKPCEKSVAKLVKKCHQSCFVALVFYTKLYIKLAVSLGSFSQFSFPFNFRTANALVLKFGTLPLSCRFSNTLLEIFDIIGSVEALPILCVRYIRWERERERYREREKDGSDVTIVALKLAMNFALLLAKNVHLSIGGEFCAFPCQKNCTSVSPLLNSAEFTLSVAQNVALFETVRILRTVKWRDWQGIEAAKQTIEFPAAPFFFLVEKIEKMNQINTKNYWK